MRLTILLLTLLAVYPFRQCPGQTRQPPVTALFREYDADSDGVLTGKEVAGTRYERQFPRWDTDQDGRVSDREIIAFRRRFGIAADGTLLASAATELKIPEIGDLPRVSRGTRLSRQAAQHSAYLLRTSPHAVSGDRYVVLTDHTSGEFLKPLNALVRHHDGELITVRDLARLHDSPRESDQVQTRLRKLQTRYVAIAPRLESFRENMLLGMWELLSTLDEDPQIDALPGLLLASDAAGFSRLIDQSIRYQPLDSTNIRPLAISQVRSNAETRSLQKAGVLRRHFAGYGYQTPVVAIYSQQADKAPRLPGNLVWNLTAPGGGKFVERFPDDLTQVLVRTNLIIMHGHGIPGMSCSLDVAGLPADMSGKILLSGSCFSAAPVKSDLPAMRQAPGGYTLKPGDAAKAPQAFALAAVDRGAVVVFGHQRLGSGFPHLYPVLEAWTRGQTVGEAYQQLLNGLIELQGFRSGDFVIRNQPQQRRQPPQNRLLYVVIGDPALQPLKTLRRKPLRTSPSR